MFFRALALGCVTAAEGTVEAPARFVRFSLAPPLQSIPQQIAHLLQTLSQYGNRQNPETTDAHECMMHTITMKYKAKT